MGEPVAIGATLVRRDIGRRLRALRQKAGLSLAPAQKLVGVSEATLLRMEAGADGVKFPEYLVKHLLDVYEAPDEERDALLGLTAETRTKKTRSWWHNYTKTALPPWFAPYVSLEDSAETIHVYQAELVPGLLQTRAYATQIMSMPQGLLDEEERERRVAVRMDRQDLLTRPRAPKLVVVLSEAAIARVCSMKPDLACEQLQHLLDSTQRGNVLIRVVPLAAGIHPGMASSAGFNLLHFPVNADTGEPTEPPMAYVDSLTGAMHLTEPDEVRSYILVWSDLLAEALDPESTRQLINSALKGISK